jgi:hypothetical protein
MPLLSRPRRPEAPVHLPLRRLALCLDCDECFEIGAATCPACGSETWTSLGRFLELAPSDPLAKLLGSAETSPPGAARRATRQLFIVARNRERLYEYVARAFADNDTVQVILDRRTGERRRQAVPHEPERRRGGDRRIRTDVDRQLRALGWAIVMQDLTAPRERGRR